MKAILLLALAAGAVFLTGCETTAVVERPYYGGGRVYYASGRPYYYTGGVRYWGYPRGYSSGYRGYGYRSSRYRDYDDRNYRYRDYDSRPRYGYSRSVERNTYVVNNRTVVRNRDRDVRYRSGDVSRRTNVKVKSAPRGQVKKKKYNRT